MFTKSFLSKFINVSKPHVFKTAVKRTVLFSGMMTVAYQTCNNYEALSIAYETNMDELIENVQKAFPKATRKQLEDFIYPLHEEFVTKYPRGMNFEKFLYETDTKDTQIGKIIFRAIDRNNDGTINAAEWVNYCAIESSEDPQQHLDFQFRAYDVNGDGYILVEELVDMIRVLTKHGDIDLRNINQQTKSKWAHVRTPDELAYNTILMCDSNHDHKIDQEEFACVSKHIIEYAKHCQAALEMERRNQENSNFAHAKQRNNNNNNNNNNYNNNVFKRNNNLSASNNNLSSSNHNLSASNNNLARSGNSGTTNANLRESQVQAAANDNTPTLARSGKRRE